MNLVMEVVKGMASFEGSEEHHSCIDVVYPITTNLMRYFITLLALFAGCLAATAQCNGDHHVAIYNYEIEPSELTIQVGESVSFTNYGGWHSINGETSYTGEDFDNPVPFNLAANYAWWFFNNCLGTVTFDEPGVYHFEDGVGNNAEHEGMVGTIIVEEGETTTVVDVIVNSAVHNLLEAAVIEADLAGALSGEGPFTVFAPTDDAFLTLATALNATAEDLLALPGLTDILLYHVVGAQVLSTDLADGATATTLLGEDVTVTINDGGIFINDAQVTVADIVTDNGVVHVIDAVLLPPTEPETTTVVDVIVNSEVHNILEAAVIEADLAGALSGEGPFTVFAPTDDAFAALAAALDATAEDLLALPGLADILLYHVVGAQVLSTDLADGATATTLLGEDVTVTINDGGIFINDAQVTVADIVTDNGVVHVIDAVLIAPEPFTVVDVIVNSEVHNILEAAVIEADLAGALSGEGPFTVFAPTDDAFAALAAALDATAEDLLALPGLADILLYHVVGAQVLSTDLADGATATTLLGEDVEVSIDCEGSIFINDAQVTIADIITDNGVVHVIDAVLLPPAPENDCVDGGCCGEGTIWDAELGQCVVDNDGCPQDVDGDFFISVGDVLSILVYFGHDCD